MCNEKMNNKEKRAFNLDFKRFEEGQENAREEYEATLEETDEEE